MRTVAIAAMMLVSAPAMARDCAAPAPLPAELSAFAHPSPLAASGSIEPGRAVTLTLAANQRFATAPAHSPAAGSLGGQATLVIAAAGTYRVALDGGAWIDLLRGDKAIESVAHSHGPACSPVRKMVDFTLLPGRYTLQLSGAAKPRLSVLVARLP